MRILVIEDEKKLASLLKQGIEEHGYAADVAQDGEEGLQRSLTTDYDAMILDLMLPRRDGADVCRAMRLSGRKTPILVLTARSATSEKIRLLDLGADDYLTKPFAFAELLARLRALMRRGPVDPRTILQAADLERDPASRTVRRGGREIELTSREFAVLEYLMRHVGVVVTRDMIAQHVWKLDYLGGSNVVDVYINYLRRKLDQGFDVKLIHTVRGAGYTVRER
ncbi:MAG: response regulator transcription factor [Myxococcales bacterium]